MKFITGLIILFLIYTHGSAKNVTRANERQSQKTLNASLYAKKSSKKI